MGTAPARPGLEHCFRLTRRERDEVVTKCDHLRSKPSYLPPNEGPRRSRLPRATGYAARRVQRGGGIIWALGEPQGLRPCRLPRLLD